MPSDEKVRARTCRICGHGIVLAALRLLPADVVVGMRRQPPAIVPFLLDAFDRCDPTRSHEAKPSERLRDRHMARRAMLACIIALAVIVAAFAASI